MAPSTPPSTSPAVPTPTDSPIGRAFRVLQTVVSADEALGVREIGRRTGLPRSTASRLVASLTDLGMVERTPDGSVIAGTALATLQVDGATQPPLLRDQLRPLLVELVQTFGESAAISIDDGDAVLYLAQIGSENPVSAPALGAERHAFHLVAPGIIAMTQWPRSRLSRYLNQSLPRPTDFSITAPAAIRARLRRADADNFVWTDQELDIGVSGLAVPVFQNDKAVASISLYGPSYRFSADERPTLASELVELVGERSAALLR